MHQFLVRNRYRRSKGQTKTNQYRYIYSFKIENNEEWDKAGDIEYKRAFCRLQLLLLKLPEPKF